MSIWIRIKFSTKSFTIRNTELFSDAYIERLLLDFNFCYISELDPESLWGLSLKIGAWTSLSLIMTIRWSLIFWIWPFSVLYRYFTFLSWARHYVLVIFYLSIFRPSVWLHYLDSISPVLWSRSRTFLLAPEPVKRSRLWLRPATMWFSGSEVAELRQFL